MNTKLLWGSMLLSTCAAWSCAAQDSGASSSGVADYGGSTGVGQGGAQDFGAFRELVDRGQLPAAETLDDVGFFNEHKIDLPPATCADALCLHSELAVVGNLINGANCTMLFLGINTAIEPGDLERPPLDLALALDTSGSMQGLPIENLRLGLELMLPELRPDDRVSLVSFSAGARTLVSLASRDSEELARAIASLEATGSTDIYAGLSTAYRELERNGDPEHERRVVLLSDGAATSGFVSSDRILALAEGYSDAGVALSVVGVGTEFDVALLRELATQAAGSFYFLDSPLALRDVFVEEIHTALLPLARDARISIAIEEGYRVRALYGVLEQTLTRESAQIDIPVLQIAHRRSTDDAEAGRRGGGGAIILELTPEAPETSVETVPSDARNRVGTVDFSFEPEVAIQAFTGPVARATRQSDILSPLAPGETPERGYFPSSSVEKSFVMLNLYAGLRSALEDVEVGDASRALATLDALGDAVGAWLEDHPDDDIRADLDYLWKLHGVIEGLGLESGPLPPPLAPWPRD